MDLHALKWSAVAACFVFSVVSGAVWFGPKTFFPSWWAALGKTASDQPAGSPVTWVLLMLTSVLQALFAAIVVPVLAGAMGGLAVSTGAAAGACLWLGFVAPSGLSNKLFAAHLKAWTIEAGNSLVNYVVFGAIIGALG